MGHLRDHPRLQRRRCAQCSERRRALGRTRAVRLGRDDEADEGQYQRDEWGTRGKYYTLCEILVQATSLNAELLSRAGKRHPHQEGPLGIIKPGAYADLVIVDGNPLADISQLGDPDKNLKLSMKDGKVYKNTLN